MNKIDRLVTRRDFVALGAGSLALLGLTRARLDAAPTTRLTSRPGKPRNSIEPGMHSLGLAPAGQRDALCYIPKLAASSAAPGILALHGATQGGQLMVTRLQPVADALGAVLLAPDSRAITWDGIRGAFDEDVAFIDRAMAWTFDRVSIDPARVWLAGFSDGASYGLSLGLANGDFFSRVLAFSPGFMPPAERRGKPRIFVSHGTSDPILPIERASRILVPELRHEGYDVRFEEFDGSHRMPPQVIDAATRWLKNREAPH